MRKAGIAIVVAACLTAAPAARADDCKPEKGYVVAAQNDRVVVTVPKDTVGSEVCYRATGRRTSPTFDPGEVLRVSGRFVAFSWGYIEGESADAWRGILLIDARKGKQSFVQFEDYQSDGSEHYRDMVLKPTGVLAWTEPKRVMACPRDCMHDGPGDPPVVVLARGRDIAQHSLERTRGGVKWRQGGRWRSAPLR